MYITLSKKKPLKSTWTVLKCYDNVFRWTFYIKHFLLLTYIHFTMQKCE